MQLQILKRLLLLVSWFTVLPKDLFALLDPSSPHPMQLIRKCNSHHSWPMQKNFLVSPFSYQAELFVSNQLVAWVIISW